MRIYGHVETQNPGNTFVPSSRGGIYNNANNPNYNYNGQQEQKNGERRDEERRNGEEPAASNVIQFDERGECDYYDEESPLVHRKSERMTNNRSNNRYCQEELSEESEEEEIPQCAYNGKILSRGSSSSYKTAAATALLFTLGLILIGVTEVYHGGFSWSKNTMSSNMIGGVTAPVSSLNEFQKNNAAAVARSSWDGYHQVCTLNSKARDSDNFCKYKTTKLTVAGDQDGKWPQGFSWTVLRENALENDKTFFHSERGEFDSDLVKGKDIKCRQYVTELCLTGDYVVYSNSDDKASALSAVNVCNKKVVAGEALDFSTKHSTCQSSSFELDPDLSEFKSKRNKHATVLQALSMSGASGAPMTSGTTGGSLSGAPMTCGADGQLSGAPTDDNKGSMPPMAPPAETSKPVPATDDEAAPAPIEPGGPPATNTTAEAPATEDGGVEEPASDDSPTNSTASGKEEPTVDDIGGGDGKGEEEISPDGDEQQADDESNEEDIAPGIYCAITYGCNDKEFGSFCNYDEGKSGMCESCAPYKKPADCEGDGLPDAGVQDCKEKCFKPASEPTIEPTAAPSETWELIWPPVAQEFVNNTLNGFTYPTFEPTTAPTNLHNSTCYMFGLLCEEDFTKLGWTGAPSSAPTSFPTYIDEDSGNNVTMPHTECYMFGLICPTVTSAPTQAPTAKPALRMIDLSEKEKKVETQRIEEKVESEANNALEIPKKITRKAKKLSSEDTFKDQEMSAYFEDEEDNFDSSKKTSSKAAKIKSKNKKVTKMYNSDSSSKKSGKLSLKSRN